MDAIEFARLIRVKYQLIQDIRLANSLRDWSSESAAVRKLQAVEDTLAYYALEQRARQEYTL